MCGIGGTPGEAVREEMTGKEMGGDKKVKVWGKGRTS